MPRVTETMLPCMESVEADVTGEVYYYCVEREIYTNGVNFCRRTRCGFFEDFTRRANSATNWNKEERYDD